MSDSFRRHAAAGSLVAWPVLLFLAFLTSPPGTDHNPAIFLAHATKVQVSAVLFLWAAAAMIPGMLALAGLLRERAPRLANLGAAVGMIGSAAAVSLFMTDFYDLALAQTLPADQAVAVTAAAGDLAGFVYAILLPAFLSHVGALILTISLAATRIGPWWLPVLVVAGIAIPFLTVTQPPAVQSTGALCQLVAYGWAAWRVLRTPIPGRG
ncbi:hypothetical protein Aple_083850 [Acrocarpospora pleiomorpha]|uniref:DUF4386 domain-containing protein n=1 Tax=Acrocarpospora pleiomorpha TaxID=90975 RepID=A0A5M3XX36_9ACTN|nr:hypothetical protein [Acrocarpospora pleiomorpha]GES25486.1 hypothetical protein Aple_083850 [Acrocarpospora pleiomorpha]